MKKTLYITNSSKECEKVKEMFLNRKDVRIVIKDEGAEDGGINTMPTLIVETWEEVFVLEGVAKIEEYLSDEPAPDYPCVCSE
ncbi:hypothetical protein [Cetobacterium sp.]|uniref:hypothetical protein n=1 Tax=Cetobacterium sp. TaxID=2071632 RepID=UPI003F2A9868